MVATLIAFCGWIVLSQVAPTAALPPAEPGAPKPALDSPQPFPNVPAGRRLLVGRAASRYRAKQEAWQAYLVHQDVVLSTAQVKDAKVATDDQTGQPVIRLTFDPQGARLFESFTRNNIKRRLAIVLDNEVMSAPVIQTAIPGGRALITLGGSGSPKEQTADAQGLAAILRSSALPAPLVIEEEMAAPNGIRFLLAVDTKAAEERWLDEWAGAIHAGLKGAGIPLGSFERAQAGYRMTFSQSDRANQLATLLSWLPMAPRTWIDPARPGDLVLSPAPSWRMRIKAIGWTEAVLARRLEELGLDGGVKIQLDGRIAVTLFGGSDVGIAKSSLFRAGRLEFAGVDDTNAYMASVADRLPDGIKVGIDSLAHEAGRSLTRYWRSEGPGGRERLVKFIQEVSRP